MWLVSETTFPVLTPFFFFPPRVERNTVNGSHGILTMAHTLGFY